MCRSRISAIVLTLLLISAVLIISPTVSQAQGCLVGGWDAQWHMAYTPISSTSATDSVSAGANLLGQRNWSFSMFSWNCETFTHPSISISTTLTQPSYWQDNVVPSRLAAATLPSNGPSGGLSGGFTLSSSAPSDLLYFTPGFDSSQTVSPLVIPANAKGVIQTVTVKVTAKDPRYFFNTGSNNPSSGIQLRFDGNIVSDVTVTPTPAPGQFFGGNPYWMLNGPQQNTQYTFTVNISVDNPNDYPIVSKPGLMAMMMVFGPPLTQQFGSSVSLFDQDLGGNIIYSLDQEVNWNPGFQQNFQVNYTPVTAQATFTAGGLCSLVKQYTTKAGIANALCAKLDNASDAKARGDLNAETGLLNAFANEVFAQTGKAFTAEQAKTLIGLLAYFQ